MTTTFFKRESRPVHGLNEDELREALVIYEEKVTAEIIAEFESEYNISLGDSEKKVIDIFISKAMTKGMEIVADTSLVTDYYWKVKKIEIDDRLGVLDKSDNTFYPCNVGEHWTTLSNILDEKYENLYEPFIELMHIKKGEDEYDGVTRDYLDKFIMDTFQFLGQNRELSGYLEEAKTEW
ncbi:MULTISPECIES: hypothetical protein [Bacillus cereus group]|uniref:hypothetical protein n=1 Tax=Bacillus cereus group TaxID=86661 RepID=UPI00202CD485|nr:hypothetical protein [Bacillus paranthracis]